MQNDFIDGSLGTAEAQKIVKRVADKIKTYENHIIYATRDTHETDYLKTAEGRHLPVEHCIRDTVGWQIGAEITAALPAHTIILDKPSFGSLELAEQLQEMALTEEVEIELIGLCTDICVVSNALLLKAYMPEVRIAVDASCCAGVSKESHEAALLTMKMCQIEVC